MANVLVHLPSKEIFRFQRVSRSFVNAIRRSPEVRKRMFLHQHIERSADTVSALNAVVNPFFIGAGGRKWYIWISRGLSLKGAIQMNPSSFLDTQVYSGLRERIMLDIDVRPFRTFGIIMIDDFVEEQETIRALLVNKLSRMSEMIPDFEERVGTELSIRLMDPSDIGNSMRAGRRAQWQQNGFRTSLDLVFLPSDGA